MKKILNILSATAILLCVSCSEDWLELSPRNSYTAGNFPTNESNVRQAVIAQYNHARGLVGGPLWHLTEFRSDNTSFIYNANDRGGTPFEQLDEFIATSDNGSIGSVWGSLFNGVARANLVLNSISTIDFANPTEKAPLEAESRFWRAWNYYHLVMLYGDVPIVEQIVTSPEESVQYTTRQPVQQVYEQIILPDIQFAVENALPKGASGVQAGRVTLGAALMLQSKILMTLGRFAEARVALESLVAQNYSLNPDFSTNFDPASKNSPESILELQTSLSQGQAIGFMGQWAPFGTGQRIWPGGTGSRSGTNAPTQDLIDAFEEGDARLGVTVGFINTSTLPGNSPLRQQYPNQDIPYSNKFNYWDATALGSDINWPLYRLSDAYLMLAECLNELGFGNSQAFEYLNLVRRRAGLEDKTQGNSDPTLSINSQEEFRRAIEKERQVELAYENHRWFDLIRTGRAEEVMTAHGVRESELKPTVTAGAYTNIRLLYAIPQIQVQNYGLTQNPGWD
ncbi:RagB/SusD family nutrient uptake outer membrane protein [Algoriphagus namhaensis]